MIKYSKSLIIIGFAAIGIIHGVYSQQDAQYTQYMYNTVSINPGYAGSRGHLSIAALHRSQWLGLDGAPVTQTLNVHAPVGKKGVGLGISVVNEEIGPSSETNFDLDVSYTIMTSPQGRLSFGLKASANLLNVNFSELDFDATIGRDPTLEQDINNQFTPNIGSGIYYHTPKFYLGLSIPRMLETTHFDEALLSTASERIHLYLITGKVFDLNPFLKFKPTVLTRYVTGSPLLVDVSANFLFGEAFILGAGYRWDAAFSGLLGYYLSESLMVGLAYDREVTDLGSQSFNDGSFEFIIRFDFIKTKSITKSPRFF